MRSIQFFFFTILIASTVCAQPANDDCAGAINVSTTAYGITCSSPTASTTIAATASTPGTACGGTSDDDDVWYSFTANSQSVVVRISNAVMIPSGNANIGVEILSGSCGALTSLFCTSSTGSGSGFTVVTGLTIGQPYYLRFWTLATSGNANFNFCVQDVAAPPANDDCAGAIAITTQPFGASCTAPVSANTTGATKSTPDPSCENLDNNDDIWYSFTASSPAIIFRFSNAVFTTSSGNATLAMALYSNACPSTTSTFFCDNNIGSGSGHQILNGLTVGVTYYLRLWSFASSNYCSFNFCVQDLPAPPANDECSGAIPITTQPFGASCAASVSANTTGATKSAPDPSCENLDNNDDIWYSFTANSQSVIIRFTNGVLTTSSGNLNLAFALYAGACPVSSSTFFCDNNIGSGSGHQIVSGLTIGSTYYLRLWSFASNNYGSFNFCVQDVPPPPANDECSNAVAITTQPFGSTCAASISVNTGGATQSTPNPSCEALDNNDDIWYSFIASSQSIIVRFSNGSLTTSSGNLNLAFALYSGVCPASTSTFFCDNNIGSGGGHQVVTGLTIGNTYYLRLWSFGSNNYGSFDFCVQDVPPPPVNDECSNAIPVTVQPFGSSCAASVSANTSGATESQFSPACGTDDTNDDIWYSFTAGSQSVIVRFTNGVLTTSSGNLNLGFALYSNACPSSTASFFCISNIGSGSGYQIVTGLTIGVTYYLRLWSFLSNNYGSFNFCVQSVPAPPVNDDCVNAISITPGPPTASCLSPVIASTAGATASVNPPSCATVSHLNDDIWYSFTASTTSHKLIITNAVNLVTGFNANIGYALYNGVCPASSASLQCAAITGSGNATVNLTSLTVGNLYYLRLWSFDLNNYASFKFCILETPMNNECSAAVTIPVTNGFCTTPVVGTLSTATISAGFGAPACNPSASAVDVWYKATVPATGNLLVQTSAVNTTVNNLVMEAYTGSCGALTFLACDDDGNPETAPSANHSRIGLSGRTPGELIYYRVMPANAGNAGDFVICAWDTTTAILPQVSPGGNCVSTTSVNIGATTSNRYMWVPVMDNAGNIIAEVYADGAELGTLNHALFVNSGPVREHGGSYFLDRNISLYAPVSSNIRIRLYYTQAEVNALNAADIAANNNNLQLIKSPDSCSSGFGNNPAVFTSTTSTYSTDYYKQVTTNSLSTFYIESICGAVITWTGNVNNDWYNPDNWDCGGIPRASSEVVVPGGRPNYPAITINTEIKKLTVSNTASVTTATGVTLKITGQ